MTGAICGPEMEEIRRWPEGIKWCFECRKRVEFFRVVMAPVDQISYYGPNFSMDCEHGHNNGDMFPGNERGWDA